MRRFLPFLTLLALVLAASAFGVVQSDAATASPEAATASVTQVDGGGLSSCARTSSGQVRCWGENEAGQLGDGTHDDAPFGTTVAGLDGAPALTGARRVVVGDDHACALLATTQVACWGPNGNGQLGDGSATNRPRPVLVTNVAGTGPLTGVTQLSLAADRTCARLATGQARCWGLGSPGDGTASDYEPRPVVVQNAAGTGPLLGVAEVAASEGHTCVRLTSGQARCWGNNYYGQLGTGTTDTVLRPAVVRRRTGPGPLAGVEQVSVGFFHTCARVTGGQVRCWGVGVNGQVGNGTLGTFANPRPEVVQRPTGDGPLTGVRQIAAADLTTCARTDTNQVRCWGYGSHGELGNGAEEQSGLPVRVRNLDGSGALANVTGLGAGLEHFCARLSSTQVRCWGGNDGGQLGDGTTEASSLPVVAAG